MMQILVSVIVPVYNGETYIDSCLKSLMSQSFPKNRYEIIVVDNCSTDNSAIIAKQYDVSIIKETQKGSYAARNKGIGQARGKIIAFTDIDCIASPYWLEQAVKFLSNNPTVEVLAGQVEFFSQGPLTVWGFFDRNTFLNQEYSFKSGVAKTANLFVSSSVFKKIGYFNDQLVSGGDVYWTAEAVSKGASIGYEPKAVVYHPVRNNFNEVAQKCFRVGIGKGQIIRKGKNENSSSNLGLNHLIHPFKLLKDTIANKEKGKTFIYSLYMIFVVIILGLIFLSGIIKGLFIRRSNKII